MSGNDKQERPAAAQEAVVTYCGRRLTPEGTRECWGYLSYGVEDLPRGTKLYAAPVAAAPVEAVNYAKLYGMACEAADHAGFHFKLDECKGVLNLLPKDRTPAAPVGDVQLALIGRRHFNGPAPQAWYAAARELMVSTPAAPGIDLSLVEQALHAHCGSSVAGYVLRDLRALIDASRKGGSDAVTELAAAVEGVLWFDWSDNDSDAVASIERLRNSLNRMQATSAEVGS